MIAPTHYRSLLTPEEQGLYKAIVKSLIRYEYSVCLPQSIAEHERIQRIVRAIHLDHPELFYVDFWNYRLQPNLLSFGTRIDFRMLLGQDTANSVAHTLSCRAIELQNEMKPEMSMEQQYYQIVRKISSTTTYVDSGSAFWDHTAAGPVLKGSAVCEGIAKLFLFFCQRLQLPCAIVTGTLNGGPHAWNMVEHKNGLRYVDVTGLLNSANCYAFFPLALFRTERQLQQAGYEW
jgi:hypothetical protein